MPRFRVTIVETEDRSEQLRCASRVLNDLARQLKVRLAPDHPLRGIHRDGEGQAYFELSTDDLASAEQRLSADGHSKYTHLTTPTDALGEPCENCGNIAGPVQPPVCPNCGFKEIAPCPVCNKLHSRAEYENLGGNVFLCPTLTDGSRHRVRFAFNEPMFNVDGTYHEPLIVVSEAMYR